MRNYSVVLPAWYGRMKEHVRYTLNCWSSPNMDGPFLSHHGVRHMQTVSLLLGPGEMPLSSVSQADWNRKGWA